MNPRFRNFVKLKKIRENIKSVKVDKLQNESELKARFHLYRQVL